MTGNYLAAGFTRGFFRLAPTIYCLSRTKRFGAGRGFFSTNAIRHTHHALSVFVGSFGLFEENNFVEILFFSIDESRTF